MADDLDKWVVLIGNGLYVAGIGNTFEGYPQTFGYVITKRREVALEFSALRLARRVADSIGGRVMKV